MLFINYQNTNQHAMDDAADAELNENIRIVVINNYCSMRDTLIFFPLPPKTNIFVLRFFSTRTDILGSGVVTHWLNVFIMQTYKVI